MFALLKKSLVTGLVLLFAWSFLEELPAQDGKEVVSKAARVKPAGLHKIPEGIDAKAFVVAKTAPEIDLCFFEGLADRGKGTLWSTWGDGCIAKSGKYYTSVGDHLGKDANAYVYEYDPVTRTLRRVVDILEAIMHMLGLMGHGKIHSGIHEGEDGKLYFTTYWGKQREVPAAYEKGFPGSLLMRYDPKSGKTENLGAIVPKQGLPASAFDESRQLLYFHAVYKGDVAVYDLKASKMKFLGGAESSTAHRTFMVADSGKVYFSGKDGLNYYDPDKNDITETKIELPPTPGAKKGSTLRAAAKPAKDGTIYGMTASGQMFSFQPKSESVKDLGSNFLGGLYTAVMVLSPDEKYLYYAPGAHGSGTKVGVPVIQYEIVSGQRKVLAFLSQPILDQFKYQVGGTYNLQIDPTGERLFITFNGSDPGARSAFGRPCMMVVHVPKGER